MVKYHEPVLLQESIDGLNINPNGNYADVTFGGGGHTNAILRILDRGKLFAFDQDKDACINIPNDKRFYFINHNFRYLKNFLHFYNALPLQGILADLGISSHQLNSTTRGFSFNKEAPLDMRMDNDLIITAGKIINQYDENMLTRIFYNYGEIRNAKILAKAISKARIMKPIESTIELVSVIDTTVNKHNRKQYYAQVFQAIRIEINMELEALKELLIQSEKVIAKGGRFVVISYHSLEDRLVKNYFQKGNIEGMEKKDIYGNSEKPFFPVNKKPITPTISEINRNPGARSAKLRIGEKN